jgi:hypothetical protein
VPRLIVGRTGFLKLKEEDMTVEEQKLKLDLAEYIDSFFNDDAWMDNSQEIGYVPDNITEIMTDAAFNVLLAVKATNKYRDENQE